MFWKIVLWYFLICQSCFVSEAENQFPIVDPGKGLSAYEEAYPMLYAAKFVYDFGDLVSLARKKAKKGNYNFLNFTETITKEMTSKFVNESCDFTGLVHDDGVSFSEIIEFLQANPVAASKGKNKKELEFASRLINNLEKVGQDMYLSTYRSIQAKVSCVYGVVTDHINRRIILTFRGSQDPDFSTRDWRSNTNIRLAKMETPKRILDKLDFPLNETVSVHSGFYEYLFDNKLLDGEQRYESIRNDIKPLLEKYPGYSLYVTGHSLGGALATLISFKLAGCRKKWVPRPVTVITYASPMTGTEGYRTAFEQCEKDGLLRHLRITLPEDPVPTIPPFGIGKTLKHVGMNLRLIGKNKFSIHHHSLANFGRKLQNSMFKPYWQFLYNSPHGLPRHYHRLDQSYEDLQHLTIDGLYQDQSKVSEQFLEGYTKLEPEEESLETENQ